MWRASSPLAVGWRHRSAGAPPSPPAPLPKGEGSSRRPRLAGAARGAGRPARNTAWCVARTLPGFLLLAALLVAASPAQGAGRIILRNLQTIEDKKVLSFNEDGVQLEGGRVLGWDEIERATVDPAQQEAFNRALAELGDPLYRVRRRLEDGDYKSIPPVAEEGSGKPAPEYKSLLTETEAVFARYAGRRSKTAYMVFQGLMWARLEAGRREEALEPYLECYEYLRTVGPAHASLPGKRRLEFDLATALTPELAPVWFDPQAAKAALPRVLAAVGRMRKPLPDGVRIYCASLALAAGEEASARNALDGLKADVPAIAQLRGILEAQREVQSQKPGAAVERLREAVGTLDPMNRPPALYWLGLAETGAADPGARREGALRLLHLPALYGKAHPELAAAGLYQAMKTLAALDDADGAASLRRELLGRYSQTFFASKLRNERSK